MLKELAILVLCTKDGLSVENIRNFMCLDNLPMFESGELQSAIASLYNETETTIQLWQTNICHTLKQLESRDRNNVIATVRAIAALPLNREEILHLVLPQPTESHMIEEVFIQVENICSQMQQTVSL